MMHMAHVLWKKVADLKSSSDSFKYTGFLGVTCAAILSSQHGKQWIKKKKIYIKDSAHNRDLLSRILKTMWDSCYNIFERCPREIG